MDEASTCTATVSIMLKYFSSGAFVMSVFISSKAFQFIYFPDKDSVFLQECSEWVIFGLQLFTELWKIGYNTE